ncbi:shikimate kinase [bacterium]|nr:shikimate kinase [bacterium]
MKTVTLTGMSGSGKTTISKILAEKLNIEFLDTDFLIEQQENLLIKEIFAQKGEKYFRNLEEKVIPKVVSSNQILSIGGGSFENEVIREFLLKNTIVIYLKTSPDNILKRLAGTSDRPLLKEMNIERINGLLEQREKHYKLAHHTVLTDNKSPEQICKEILKCLN